MTLPMDIRIAAKGAKIGFIFARRGLVPGSRQRLVPAEAGRPAAGAALVPVGPDVRRR